MHEHFLNVRKVSLPSLAIFFEVSVIDSKLGLKPPKLAPKGKGYADPTVVEFRHEFIVIVTMPRPVLKLRCVMVDTLIGISLK